MAVGCSSGSPDEVEDRRLLDRRAGEIDREVRFVADEFRAGLEAVAQIDRPAVAVFGSARIPSGPEYDMARRTGRLLAETGFAVVTGGGPGLMEATNRGCREAGGLSVGFNIDLPHEQGSNAYLDISYTFEHFFARKTMFVKAAEGFIVFPGGFGTMDELFDSLTLIQNRKIDHFPVALVGPEHWGPLMGWVAERLLGGGLISPVDLELLSVVDQPEDAVGHVVACFRHECAHELGAIRALG